MRKLTLFFITVFTLISFLNIGCKKTGEPDIYYGEVINSYSYCNSLKGTPYVVKYTTLNNAIDSFLTTSLIAPYQLPGTKISFQIYPNVISEEAITFCVAQVIPPVQRSIYDVNPQ